MKSVKVFKLTCAAIVFYVIPTISAKFTCQTPDPSDSIENTSEQFNDYEYNSLEHFNRDVEMSRWKNNIVKFSIDSSLTEEDRNAVDDAIQDYHTKTCIRFEPKENHDQAYVHIKILKNSKICGYATGERGKRQVIAMGSSCRTKHTMIHEFGHIIGLDHEHQRRDREDYINFRECDEQQPILRQSRPVGFYDYQSVMHYSCGWCGGGGWPTQSSSIKCGEDFSNELSVLDADHINRMHDCGGCKRHRWHLANKLTSADRNNLYSFGYTNSDGQPVYPCRSLYRGSVVVGHGAFDQSNAKCEINYSNGVISLKNNVEVLTIPGGLFQRFYNYELTDRKYASVAEAIPVATKYYNARKKVFIAYGSRDTIKVGWVVANNNFTHRAKFVVESDAVRRNEYKVLTCSYSSSDEEAGSESDY